MRAQAALAASFAQGARGLIAAIQGLAAAGDATEILGVVERAARQVTGADGAVIVIRDADGCRCVGEDAIAPLWEGQRFSFDECLSGWVIQTSRAVVIPDIASDARVPLAIYRPTFVRSLAIVPMAGQNPIGTIGIFWARRHAATDEEVQILQALADSASIALENAAIHSELEQRVSDRTATLEETNARLQREIAERIRVEAEVRQLSLSDELTGLYNRRGFMLLASQELKVVNRSERRALILYIDLDGLKVTNDTRGHAAGDKLIVAAAKVLRRCARESDVIGRLGGDEFAVLMHVGDHDLPIPAIVERLLQAARQSGIHISVGATATVPGRHASLEDLLSVADETMYRGRRARRSA